MNLTRGALFRRTTVMTAVLLLLAVGAQTFLTMSRREDPEIQIRVTPVVTRWPGATATKVEELVTDPLEEAIAQISEVKTITSVSRAGLSDISVELEDHVKDVDQIWDELRAKVDEVANQLPAGVKRPNVYTGFGDVFSLCLAVFQQAPDGHRIAADQRYSWRELEIHAERIQDAIKALPSVAKVDLVGTQQEVIELLVKSRDWGRMELTEGQLAQLVDARNIVASGGVIDTGTTRYPVRPTGEFDAIDQLESVVVSRRDNVAPITLGQLPFTIKRTHATPIPKEARYFDSSSQGNPTIVLAISMKEGHNVVAMGEAVQRRIAELQSEQLPADLVVRTVNDLPRQVDGLVQGFIENLFQAILIVLFVAFLMMGFRPALIMAVAVPLSMIGSFVLMPLFEVELEQFSIASLIIALGMIVDNAIVVSDNCVRLLGEGVERKEACVRGASELAIPIFTSTMTTIAAFLPLLTMSGSSGEYIRSLPIVVSTTLLMSYGVAMLVTPIFCYWLLPAGGKAARSPLAALGGLLGRILPTRKGATASKADKAPLYDRIILWCLAHKAIVLVLATAALVGALSLGPLIGSQFFPAGNRDQLFVTVWLPEGSSIEATEAVVEQVETIIRDSRMTTIEGESVDRLANGISFVGTGGPRFFLTSSPEKDIQNYAYIIVNTSGAELSAPWVTELQQRMDGILDAEVTVERFVLGPAIRYPVEVRLSGPDADVLREQAEEIVLLLRDTPGTLGTRSDWRGSSYEVEIDVDESAANLAGVTNQDVATTLSGLINGKLLTTFREGDHTIDVRLRVEPEERGRLETLDGIWVNGQSGKVPLASIATTRPAWQPSIVARRDQIRTVTVGAKVAPGFLANEIARQLKPGLDKLVDALPPGYSYEFAGELGETQESQQKIFGAFQISFLLILLILISQYNSISKPMVVLAAVPLSLIGALLGLFLTGWALGFMPMLGIVSLAGVVINNAIILIDFIQSGIRSGTPVRQAVAEAGRLRMKPIVLTTLTTIGGMLPLALFGGPMWAGMAWAVMVGLGVSTALTLFVVPTLYTLLVERFGVKA